VNHRGFPAVTISVTRNREGRGTRFAAVVRRFFLLDYVAESALPARCALCGTLLQWNPWRQVPICDECPSAVPIAREETNRLVLSGARAGGLVRSRTPRCRACSRPLISEREFCTRCRNREFLFDRHISVYRYRGSAKALVQAYKFRGRADLAPLFARELASLYREHFSGLPLVPVPPRPGASRDRAFDPVGLLVRHLSRETGAPVRRLLTRRRGVSQKSLSYTARLTNLRGRILLRRAAGDPVTETRSGIVLVDDVFTTGATSHECARVLKQAGFPSVYVLTVAMD